MEKCLAKDLLYNAKTKRCYKSCEKKDKVTHPVTQKCRQKCKSEKIRRIDDFRCVKKTLKKIRIIKKKKAAIVKPAEELIPPPLQKELIKNFHFINELLKKGKDKNISYDESRHVSELITIYFHEKYKQNCPMYPIKTYNQFDQEPNLLPKLYEKYKKKFTIETLKERLMNEEKSYFIDWNIEKFLKNLKLCLETGEQLIIIPLRIPNHLNMVIVKAPTREIIRFEPHGSAYQKNAEDIKTNDFLENLVKEINVYLELKGDRQFKYIEPKKTCPRRYAHDPDSFYDGWQIIEERNQVKTKDEAEVGFCQLWSWFFAECVINNPEMPITEVYQEANKVLRENMMGFATIIRGYFLSINEELVKMKKTFSIKKSYIKNIENNDLLLMYLNEKRGHLQAKARKPFVGGERKVKFILPTANPKVKSVKL
jgi:hypothetical protein